MEADPAPALPLPPGPPGPPGPRARRRPRPLRCRPPRGRTSWPRSPDAVAVLRSLERKDASAARSPTRASEAPGSCWELPCALTTARGPERPSAEPPGRPAGPRPKRPRKHPRPRRGAEKADPGFSGVTLTFQLRRDSGLQILPTYSWAFSSLPEGSPASPARVPEPSTHEALGHRRCCASCRTQRTPLWRDAEDGTPLCNACGIRYKKYGTRCSSCWLVPRKNVHPKRLCGRCGVSLVPNRGRAQEM